MSGRMMGGEGLLAQAKARAARRAARERQPIYVVCRPDGSYTTTVRFGSVGASLDAALVGWCETDGTWRPSHVGEAQT